MTDRQLGVCPFGEQARAASTADSSAGKVLAAEAYIVASARRPHSLLPRRGSPRQPLSLRVGQGGQDQFGVHI